MSDYTIRQMTRAELDMVVEWAAREGWNPGRHDAEAFYATDPTGFYVGELDGRVIASISAVKYGPSYAFVGYYIVAPGHRGKGYGLRLWEHAHADIEGVPAGLDGVLAQTANYERSGYEDVYHNRRYQGVNLAASGSEHEASPLADEDYEDVVAYDSTIFPAPRERFLSLWLTQPEAKKFVVRGAGAIQGYGVIRPARDGWRVGPLFADAVEQAETLLDALISSVLAGQPVFIDVPQTNAEATAMVQRRGMTPMFETARMYRGGAPSVDVGRVFGVTSLELG